MVNRQTPSIGSTLVQVAEFVTPQLRNATPSPRNGKVKDCKGAFHLSDLAARTFARPVSLKMK